MGWDEYFKVNGLWVEVTDGGEITAERIQSEKVTKA